jgi:hypothetical protein
MMMRIQMKKQGEEGYEKVYAKVEYHMRNL